MARIIYNNDTLAGATTWPTTNNLVYSGDLELIQDPETRKWTLLILQTASSWSGVDGRIIAMALADNGDFAGGAENFKIVLSGIETGGPSASPSTRQELYGMEFDADPIPEPGTLLLIGTGVLGFMGYLRRRRMQ